MPHDDPRLWTATDIEDFAESAEALEIVDVVQRLAANPDDRALAALRAFLGATGPDLDSKPMPSQLGFRALVAAGPTGIEKVKDALLDPATRVRYAAALFEALFALSRGLGVTDPMASSGRGVPEMLDIRVSPEAVEAAATAVADILGEAATDPEAQALVAGLLSRVSHREHAPVPALVSPSDLIVQLVDTSIRLSPSVLRRFEALIEEAALEERYQEFLAANPALLDPLAAEVIPKQRLGIEYATDFAIRRHDERWILVEIERPQDRLFTAGNDLAARFTHAFGQVVDFLHWVDENVSYAQQAMPRIAAPRGLLVMGLRAPLSDRQQAKLRHFATNSSRIEIATYDDLLAQSTHLYASMRSQAPRSDAT